MRLNLTQTYKMIANKCSWFECHYWASCTIAQYIHIDSFGLNKNTVFVRKMHADCEEQNVFTSTQHQKCVGSQSRTEINVLISNEQ